MAASSNDRLRRVRGYSKFDHPTVANVNELIIPGDPIIFLGSASNRLPVLGLINTLTLNTTTVASVTPEELASSIITVDVCVTVTDNERVLFEGKLLAQQQTVYGKRAIKVCLEFENGSSHWGKATCWTWVFTS